MDWSSGGFVMVSGAALGNVNEAGAAEGVPMNKVHSQPCVPCFLGRGAS